MEDTGKIVHWGNWTEFDLNLNGDAIYLSGINYDNGADDTFMNVLRKQELIHGFPGNKLPGTTYYFHNISVSNLHSVYNFTVNPQYSDNELPDFLAESDRRFYYFLQEYANYPFLSCQFLSESDEHNPCAVINIPIDNIQHAKNALDQGINNIKFPTIIDLPDDFLITTPVDKYPIKLLPPNTIFARFSGVETGSAPLFSCFYHNSLLLAPNVSGLESFIHMMEENFTLQSNPMYEESIGSLPGSYNFLLMADMERLFRQPENYINFIPDFFFRHQTFFRDFTLSVQFSCIDNIIYPNIVLLYKGKNPEESEK